MINLLLTDHEYKRAVSTWSRKRAGAGQAYYSVVIKIRFRFSRALRFDILHSTPMRRQFEHGKVLSQRI